jgi:hypothetical protein
MHGKTGSNTSQGATIYANTKNGKITPGDEWTDDDSFAVPPRSAWRLLRGSELKVYAEVMFQQFVENKRDGCAPYDKGIAHLAWTLNISEPTCQRAVDSLEKKGWIIQEKHGTGNTTIDVLKAPRYGRLGFFPLPDEVARPKREGPISFDFTTGEVLDHETKVCAGMTKGNVPCRIFVTDNDYCRHHDPDPATHKMYVDQHTKCVSDSESRHTQNVGSALDTQRGNTGTTGGLQLEDTQVNYRSSDPEREQKEARILALEDALGVDDDDIEDF